MILRLLLVSAFFLGPGPMRAQTPSGLDEIDSLVMAGRTEDARQALTTWWDRVNAPVSSKQRAPTVSAELQHAVWLRAVLTVDPAQAAVDYQRLVVEYPGGPYSDRALLRLAQAAEARGDALRACEHLRTLLRDYPTSPARLDAGRMLPSVESAARAQARGAVPSAGPGPGLSVSAAALADEAVSPTPVPAPAPAGSWTVQLGAFASLDRARALRDKIGAGHLEARIILVPPSRLIRVRTGRFQSKARAEGLRSALAVRGLEATVSGDADREEATP